MNYAARKLFLGFRMPEDKEVTDLQWQEQYEQGAVRAHDESACLLGRRVLAGTSFDHYHWHTQADALAPTQIADFGRMCFWKTHRGKARLQNYRHLTGQL
jgi:hypothetical protein